MALRHVREYFLQVEHDYFEMTKLLPEFEKLAAEGKITPEDYEFQVKDVQRLRDNYDRISYIMFLMNKPNRKEKDEDEYIKSWYNTLQYSSKEAILDENKDVLKHFKEVMAGKDNEM